MTLYTIVIVARDETENIGRCLDSCPQNVERLVVDTGSQDDTIDIARKKGARLEQLPWRGFASTKQAAVDLATHDWVLVLDADETLSPELAERLTKIFAGNPVFRAWRIHRRSFYLGRLIRYSGWQNDFTLRLFHRAYAKFNAKLVHEHIVTREKIGTIPEPLFHYPYATICRHWQKINLYSSLGAEELYQNGKTISIIRALCHGIAKFLKMFILKRGFLDGRSGLILALLSSWGVSLKYLKLWEKNHLKSSI